MLMTDEEALSKIQNARRVVIEKRINDIVAKKKRDKEEEGILVMARMELALQPAMGQIIRELDLMQERTKDMKSEAVIAMMRSFAGPLATLIKNSNSDETVHVKMIETLFKVIGLEILEILDGENETFFVERNEVGRA